MTIERNITTAIELTNSELAEEVLCMNIIDIADLFNKISEKMINSTSYRADLKRLAEEFDKHGIELIRDLMLKIAQYYSEQ